jgi:hypothetical protein
MSLRLVVAGAPGHYLRILVGGADVGHGRARRGHRVCFGLGVSDHVARHVVASGTSQWAGAGCGSRRIDGDARRECGSRPTAKRRRDTQVGVFVKPPAVT